MVCTSNTYGSKYNNDNGHSSIDINVVCTSNVYGSELLTLHLRRCECVKRGNNNRRLIDLLTKQCNKNLFYVTCKGISRAKAYLLTQERFFKLSLDNYSIYITTFSTKFAHMNGHWKTYDLKTLLTQERFFKLSLDYYSICMHCGMFDMLLQSLRT